MTRIRWHCGLAGIVLFAVASEAHAQAPERPLGSLFHTGWTVREGAPGDIAALAQTHDGFLWLGTQAGLFRFDGVQFERIDAPAGSEFPSSAVSALYAPPEGGLWIGYRYGGASFLADGRLRNFTEQDGFSTGSVFGFARDADGALWTATFRGLMRRRGDAPWQWVGSEAGFGGVHARAVAVDAAGTVWAASEDTLFAMAHGANTFVAQRGRTDLVSDIVFAADATPWLAQTDGPLRAVLREGAGGHLAEHGMALRALGATVDGDGSFWIATPGNGVRRLVHGPSATSDAAAAASEGFTEAQGLTSDYVQSVLEDREGNFWFGTAGGLDRFRVANLTPAPFPKGAHDFALVTDNAGSLWAGTRNQPLLRLRNGRLEPTGVEEFFSCAYRDPTGLLWFGNRNGLWRGEGDQLALETALPALAKASSVQAITRDGSGTLWISLNVPGVFKYTNGHWEHVRDAFELLTRASPLTLVSDREGRVWMGFSHNRIVRAAGDTMRLYDNEAGLDVGNVTAMYPGGDGLWVGGERGLAVADGERFRAVLATDADALRGISGIVDTAAGDLWLHGSRGAMRLTASERARAVRDPLYAVKLELYDVLDGMPGAPAQFRPLPSLVAGAGGQLWFATTGGVVSLDPQRLTRNLLPPPVLIRSVDAGEGSVPALAERDFPAGTSALRIRYTATSLSVPERVRFRYRLIGQDDSWQDAGTRREAAYTNLAPGDYRFQVIAANDSGVWNQEGAAIDLHIAPRLHQTLAFRIACVLAAAVALCLLYLWRLRQLAARLRLQSETRHLERERIARELHDTLLQSVQGLLLRFQAAAHTLPDGTTRDALEGVLDRAEQTLAEGRDRVRDLRVDPPADCDLLRALTLFAQENADPGQLHFRAVVAGATQRLPPLAYEEVYRIAREGLLNAFRHAQARNVELEIEYAPTGLRLLLRDDGRGIDEEVLRAGGRAGHFGLHGMHERAARLGARLTLWSKPGLGTEWELMLPAAIAYAHAESTGVTPWWRR